MVRHPPKKARRWKSRLPDPVGQVIEGHPSRTPATRDACLLPRTQYRRDERFVAPAEDAVDSGSFAAVHETPATPYARGPPISNHEIGESQMTGGRRRIANDEPSSGISRCGGLAHPQQRHAHGGMRAPWKCRREPLRSLSVIGKAFSVSERNFSTHRARRGEDPSESAAQRRSTARGKKRSTREPEREAVSTLALRKPPPNLFHLHSAFFLCGGAPPNFVSV